MSSSSFGFLENTAASTAISRYLEDECEWLIENNLCLFCSYPKHLCVLCALARNVMFFSRRGAEPAENFDVYFVLTQNTFAYFAPWREILCFSLAKARRPPRTSCSCLFLSQTTLCILCLGEDLFVFFSRRGAEVAENFDVYFVLIQNTFAYFAPWREIFIFFLSQRRRGRRELHCIFCSYLKNLCVLCVLARNFYIFSLAKAPRSPRISMFILFLPQTPLCSLRLCENKYL